MKKLFSFFVIALMAIGVNAGNGDNGTTMTDGPYKVGDYYNDGTNEGIVFEVYDDGWHGKIVSLDYSEELWAVDAVIENRTGATSNTGGMSNMNKIKELPNWEDNYPAFAWCASLGSDWYLPAVDELVLISENMDAVNMGLSRRGYEGLTGWYWSSTESSYDESHACYVKVDDGHTGTASKTFGAYVRAVSAF